MPNPEPEPVPFSLLQVVGWDADGTITFNDVVCKGNEAANNGGCFHGAGRGVVNRGTSMLNNSAAGNGGSIREPNNVAWVSFVRAQLLPPENNATMVKISRDISRQPFIAITNNRSQRVGVSECTVHVPATTSSSVLIYQDNCPSRIRVGPPSLFSPHHTVVSFFTQIEGHIVGTPPPALSSPAYSAGLRL